MSFALSRLRAYDASFAGGFVLFALLTTLLCTYGRMYILDGDYPRAIGEYYLLTSQCLDGKRLITGDSVTRDGIDPRILGDDILNVSLGASNPIELYFEMKDMHWCQSPPKTVYISIMPHHFMNDDGYWNGSVRYGLISREEMREVREDSQRLSSDFVYNQGKISFTQKIGYWLKEHRAPTLYLPSIRNSLLNFRHGENVLTYAHILANQGYAASDTHPVQPPFPDRPPPTKLAPEGTDKAFTPNPLAELYLNKMLQLLQDEHINVVMFSMPISDITNAAMTKEYAEGYEVFLKHILSQHKGVRFVGDVFPVMPIRYFNDQSHMIGRGAYDWTVKIKPMLNGE